MNQIVAVAPLLLISASCNNKETENDMVVSSASVNIETMMNTFNSRQ